MTTTLRTSLFFLVFVLTSVAAFDGCQSQSETSDLVVRGGTVITMDEAYPEAEALAIRDGRILAVGTDAEIRSHIGNNTRIIDLDGATAFPGFIEGHGHFLGLGQMKMGLELMPTTSWQEIVTMVQQAVRTSRPGQWIVGRGWHQEKWTSVPQPNVEGFPLHDALSAVSPNNPVLLTHASGHATIANRKAMQLAGITRATPDPEGGEILHDRAGEPIGIFRETAQQLVRSARLEALAARNAEEIEADDRKAVDLAVRECLSKGVTSFQDAGSSFKEVDFFRKLADEGSLGIRLWVMVRDSLFKLKQQFPGHRIIGAGDNHLTVRAIKWSIDGALGARGAWLLKPYSDMSTSTGLNTAPIDSILESAELAMQNGLQICVHAIGDRANRETLDLYARVFARYPDRTGLRWRIEHAQHLHPADIPRFAELGVIPAMQGIHCTSDAPYVTARLGSQRAEEGAYVWRSLIQSGVTIVNGTDTPVEDVDPVQNFYASVTRKLKDGSSFYPDQRMTRMEALRSYTLDAAYGAFEEELKGSLSPGKLADITILSDNILTVPEDAIPSVHVLTTILGGTVVYERPAP
jgi:predicted amidohydrolase YtcJ